MPAEGAKAINKANGATATFSGGVWVQDKPGAGADASLRGRLTMGLGPMVKAETGMEATEARGNPFSLTANPGNAAAKLISGIELPPWLGGGKPLDGAAKYIGGQDFQDYDQAASTYEAQLMPIMSGAAVSPSEAQRQIRSALPALGDSPATLAKKAATRRQMLNGAGKAQGVNLPYPGEPTYGVNTQDAPGGAPKVRRYNPKTGTIE